MFFGDVVTEFIVCVSSPFLWDLCIATPQKQNLQNCVQFPSTDCYKTLFRISIMFGTVSRLRSAFRKLGGARSFKMEPLRYDPRIKGPITFYSLGLATLVGLGIIGMYYIEKDRKAKKLARQVITVGKPALGGEWILVDQDGVARTDASYHGYFTILYFGFTHCPDICPSEMVKIGKIMKELGTEVCPPSLLSFTIHFSSHANRKEEDTQRPPTFHIRGSQERHSRTAKEL
jgi:hypothetical protein